MFCIYFLCISFHHFCCFIKIVILLVRFFCCQPSIFSVSFNVLILFQYGKQLKENYKAFRNKQCDQSNINHNETQNQNQSPNQNQAQNQSQMQSQNQSQNKSQIQSHTSQSPKSPTNNASTVSIVYRSKKN